MDVPSPNSSDPTVPRQRASPADSHASSPSISPPPQQQQQPYPYPVQQQQQAGWTPSQPFYPSFYQNHQQPYPVHPAQGQIPHQGAYYDPAANAQFAQWAYQQMMYSAQQPHHFMPSSMPGQGRGRSASASSPGDYFAPGQMPNFNPFPSGTPPAHPSQIPPSSYSPGSGRGGNASPGDYAGFHPYRRPTNRQGSGHSSQEQQEWRPPGVAGPFQPPYARADAAGSSSSVNSTSSSGGSRQRTSSLQGGSNNTGHGSTGGSSGSTRSRNGAQQAPVNNSNGHARTGSGSAAPSPTGSSTSTPASRTHPAHHRNLSSSSASSSASRPSAPSQSSSSAASGTSSPHGSATARPMKPSPLSQGNFTAAEKRMSRDDSDLTAMLDPVPGLSERRGGIKGRLRRALSLNAAQTLREEEEEDNEGGPSRKGEGRSKSEGGPSAGDASDTASNATVQTKKKRFVFNSRFNRSTDNISISSVSSSASVMIRKIGSLGKLARRNSLAGITSLFKEKGKEEGDDGKKSKKKQGKGEVSEASVSHVTAELDRGDWGGADFSGLSPAAKLARQHTLKSNAEAAAKAKAQAEAAAKGQNGELPSTWEKNTTNRDNSHAHAGGAMVAEDGTRVMVEDDDSGSDDGTYDEQHGRQAYGGEGWDDGQNWGEEEEEEDVTIRMGLERAELDDDYNGELEPWATNVRRSVEKARKPAKGILKKDANYSQEAFLDQPPPSFPRARSNSYDAHPASTSELGPLAHIPSPDPDHIDGLHRHGSHSSSHSPSDSPTHPLFEAGSRKEASEGGGPEKGLFNHSNSSAPALSTIFANGPPTLQHRSATAPAKRLAFAQNLSVYDTFPPSVYDRRSEPATWSRLTPALAQRIKEELNSYKMEEMEVHASSRIHTQFFV
ncbi:hypothetical protein OE88DRAFT_1651619 [Heliocybe sulcata]|uniref:Uncharacterized protein n=1 Tax=Heliocybe sulcata TaxID=5364 RepID=A0A5C3NVH4_9AGAM|nr:hypothetical protein OE88DRAFT_1651619 [Heliocybe sulcata]